MSVSFEGEHLGSIIQSVAHAVRVWLRPTPLERRRAIERGHRLATSWWLYLGIGTLLYGITAVPLIREGEIRIAVFTLPLIAVSMFIAWRIRSIYDV
jgi:hypothetical protein